MVGMQIAYGLKGFDGTTTKEAWESEQIKCPCLIWLWSLWSSSNSPAWLACSGIFGSLSRTNFSACILTFDWFSYDKNVFWSCNWQKNTKLLCKANVKIGAKPRGVTVWISLLNRREWHPSRVPISRNLKRKRLALSGIRTGVSWVGIQHANHYTITTWCRLT